MTGSIRGMARGCAGAAFVVFFGAAGALYGQLSDQAIEPGAASVGAGSAYLASSGHVLPLPLAGADEDDHEGHDHEDCDEGEDNDDCH